MYVLFLSHSRCSLHSQLSLRLAVVLFLLFGRSFGFREFNKANFNDLTAKSIILCSFLFRCLPAKGHKTTGNSHLNILYN